MTAAFDVIKVILWLLVRAVFVLARSVVWKFNGVSWEFQHIRASKRYEKSAHVRRIWFRSTFSTNNFPTAENIFITMHESFEDPEYVLRECVTLCHVTEKEAMFVETDPQDDVLDPNNGGFMKVSQCILARKFIVMPMESLHALAQKLPDVSDKIAFLSNTSRCGSTLVVQLFQETGFCLSFGEPDLLNNLVPIINSNNGNFRNIVADSLKLLCKPIDRPIRKYIIKMLSPSLKILPTLYEMYPKSNYLFMYREPLPTIRSLNKLLDIETTAQLLFLIGPMSTTFTWFIFKISSVPTEIAAELGRLRWRSDLSSILWANAVKQYLEFRQQGIPIQALKYEEFVGSTRTTCAALFRFLGVAFDEKGDEAIRKAFSKDSQRNTELSRERMAKAKEEIITDEIMERITMVCTKFGVPTPNDQPVILAGTIGQCQENM